MKESSRSPAFLSCWVKRAGRNFFAPNCNNMTSHCNETERKVGEEANSSTRCDAEGCSETRSISDPTSSSWPFYEVWSAFGVSYACIGCGNFLGYTSSAVPSMIADSQTFATITSAHVSLIGGLGPLGALVGSLLTAITSRFLGTRRTIALLGIPSLLLSWICIYFATSVGWILTARFIGGIGCGSIIATAPLYIVDISSDSRRGKLGMLPQFLMLIGIVLSYVAGNFLDWRLLTFACFLILCPSIPFIFLCPDSPTWLLSKNPKENESKVTKTLVLLKGSTITAKRTLGQLQDNIALRNSNLKVASNSVWSNISSPQTYKPLVVSICLICLQQLTGINGVTFYAHTILTPTSTTTDHESYMTNISAIILASTQVVASFVSSFFVERCGRKFLLLISSSSVFMAGVFLGIYFFLRESSILPLSITSSPWPWAPLSLLMLFAFGFALGLGPVIWILIAEILPQETRHLLNPIVIALNWMCTFAVTSSFPWLLQLVDLYGIFWIYAIVAGMGVVFVYFFVPETKGKSQDQIKELFQKASSDEIRMDNPLSKFNNNNNTLSSQTIISTITSGN